MSRCPLSTHGGHANLSACIFVASALKPGDSHSDSHKDYDRYQKCGESPHVALGIRWTGTAGLWQAVAGDISKNCHPGEAPIDEADEAAKTSFIVRFHGTVTM